MRTSVDGWIFYAVISFLLFGLWGFFPKLATLHMHPKSALVYEVLGGISVGIVVFCLVRFRPEFHPKGSIYAALTGVTGTLGVLFFLYAVSRGKTSVVVTMTALYPVVTILLAGLILREPVTFTQGLGIAFALTAMLLFSL